MFNANHLTSNHTGVRKCMKKPIVIHAAQISEPFEVTTKEGIMTGKAHDYLMFGIDGEKYICDRSIFERSYDFVDDKNNPIN